MKLTKSKLQQIIQEELRAESNPMLKLFSKLAATGDQKIFKKINHRYGPFAVAVIKVMLQTPYNKKGDRGWELVRDGKATFQQLQDNYLDLARIKEMSQQTGNAPVFQAARNLINDLGL